MSRVAEWFFFETRAGDWLIERFELSTGLALVPVDWMDDLQIGLAPTQPERDQGADLEWQPSEAARASIPDAATFGKAFLID